MRSSRLISFLLFAGASSVAFSASPAGPQPTPPSPASTPAMAQGTAPAPAKPKVAKPLDDSKRAEVLETTKIDPELTYRMAYLDIREGSAFHKEEHQDYLDQLYLNLHFLRDRDLRQEVVLEPSIRTPRGNPGGTVETVIEQGYVQFVLGKYTIVTAGRKAEYGGSGFSVNPSDLLNEDKDQFDPLAEKQGQNFTRITLKLPAWSASVGFIPNAGNSVKTGKLWLQTSGEFAGIDIRMQHTAQETEKCTEGVSLAKFFGDRFELHYDGRFQARQRSSAEQEERVSSSYEPEDSSFYYLVGTRVIVANRRSVILEGIQNESGLDDFEMEDYHSRMRALEDDASNKKPPTHIIGRHYGFIAYQDEDTIAKTMLSASALVNTIDQSVYGTLSAKYSISPITSVELAPTFFRGKSDSEFGEQPFASAIHLIFRGKF